MMRNILEQSLTFGRLIDRNDDSLAKPIGIFAALFGCWHKDMSRPFTTKHGSYRVCTDCGARRRFDTTSFRTLGRFYYAPFGDARP